MVSNSDDPLSDLENFKNKEALLNAIRHKREQAATTDTSVGDSIRRPILDVQDDNRTNGSAGRGETSTLYGSNTEIGYEHSSGDSFSDQLGRLRSTVARSDGSSDEYNEPVRKRSAWSNLKSVGNQYKQIFTKKETHTDAPIRLPKKVDGKRLTDAEVLRLRPKLREYVLWQSEHLDQFIIATTVGHDSSIEIWGDITPEEAEIIVDYLLARGKNDIRTAQAVRYASTLIDRLKLGLIIGPRMYKTAMIYIQRGFSIKYA